MNKFIERKKSLYRLPCDTCMFRTIKKRKGSKSLRPFGGYCNCPDYNRKEFLENDNCDNYLPNNGEFIIH